MAFDLFGYNGVFEFDQSSANKLLATFLYERHLVRIGGTLTDGDFFSVTAAIKNGSVNVYLELGRPFLHIQAADGTNLVTLHVPFSQLGAFVSTAGSVRRQSVPKLALVIFDSAVNKTALGLSVDFTRVTANSIGIQAIGIRPGPTGVGGQQILVPIFLDDNTITNQLKDPMGNITTTGGDLRAKLAEFIRTGALGPTSVPLSLGGAESALASFDLMLFGNANDRDINDSPNEAGVDLLLFDVDGKSGQGVRTDATQTLPVAPEEPPFTWALSIRESVLQDDIQRALDTGTYYVQGRVQNTPSTPLGYLVVPAAGSRTGSLPGGGTIVVNATKGGRSQVSIPAGGLTPNGRARLRNLDRHVEVAILADGNGATTLTIATGPGDRLALTVDAVSLPTHSDIIIWRPTLTFQEGSVQASFHYHYNIPHWCDLDGDATVTFALFADRTKPFSVGVKVTDANASVPWWVYVVAWLGPALLGQEVFAPILVALIPTIVHSIAGDFVGGKLGSAASGLTDHLSAPSPDNVALLLDQVDVHQTGIEISGRSDASIFLGYGRLAAFSTQTGVVLTASTPAPVYMRFDWKPDIASISIGSPVPIAVISDNARNKFWAFTYDDLPQDSAFLRDAFPMSVGDTTMVWVAVQSGHAKVLFEWTPSGGDAPSTGIRITWIAYRDRVDREVHLINNITATVVGGSESLLLEQRFHRYDGSIDLTTQKFFLSDETLAVGDEHWFWDDQELTDQQALMLPGGSVTLDASNRRLLVHLDQSGLAMGGQEIPITHWVKFSGKDVFGNTLETKLLVQTLPVTLTARPIAIQPPFGLINPLGGDTGPAYDPATLVTALVDLLAPQVGAAQAVSLATSMASALATGSGRIDATGASAILSLLAAGRGQGNIG